MKLVIPGRPVPAVRMTQRGKFVKPNAKRYLEYKESVGWTGRTVIKSPIQNPHEASVEMRFYLYRGGHVPDIDNLIKAILDGLNKIAWEDDRQVVKVTAWRFSTLSKEKERAEVEINSF